MEKTSNNWKRRKLTLLGKVNIAKSVGLSKLIYNASVLPVPKNFCDQVNKITWFGIWFDKGVYTLKHLLDPNLDFLTCVEFKLRYQLRTNFLTYYGLINSIPQEYKKAIKRTSVQQEHLTQPWENLKALTTKAIHKSFVKHVFEEPPQHYALLPMG